MSGIRLKWIKWKQKEILTQANKLVSSNQHQAAIDLLLRHLNLDSNSSQILRALGRVYRLNNQPEKAVIYLKRSLDAARLSAGLKDNYDADEFNIQDLVFIDELSADNSQVEYDFEKSESSTTNTNHQKKWKSQQENASTNEIEPKNNQEIEVSDQDSSDEWSLYNDTIQTDEEKFKQSDSEKNSLILIEIEMKIIEQISLSMWLSIIPLKKTSGAKMKSLITWINHTMKELII